MKPVTWMGSAKRDLVACAPDVRQVVGRELERVQRGADPIDWKPMASVGPGAREIRVHVGGERRVVYVATFPEAVGLELPILALIPGLGNVAWRQASDLR